MNSASNFNNFVDALTQELIDMPDEQVLEGLDVSELQARAQTLLKSARAEAGRRRLAAAKAGVVVLRGRTIFPTVEAASASVAKARQFLEQAQNDTRFTLAARKLGEMPDDEVLRLYAQIVSLGGLQAADKGNSE